MYYADRDISGLGDTLGGIFYNVCGGYWDYDNNRLKHMQLRFYPTDLFPE